MTYKTKYSMKDKNILIEENYSSENPSISEALLNKAFCNYSYFYKSCVPIPNVVSNKASHCLSIECFLITSIDGLFGPSHFLPSDGSAMSSWENAECSPQICFSIFNHNTLIWSSSPLQFPHEHQKWFHMDGIHGAISLFCWIFSYFYWKCTANNT